MKKTLLAAVAALLALAAPAVTVNWNQDVDWGDVTWRGLNMTDGWRDIGHIGATTKAVYRLNIRFRQGVPTSGCVLMLGGTVGGVGGYGITLSATANGLVASLKDENHEAGFTPEGGGEPLLKA